MKRIKWFVLLLITMNAVGAFADSFASFSASTANFYFGPNYLTDDAGFLLTGPGIDVSGGGGTPEGSWLGTSLGYAPGSIGGGPASAEFDEGMFGTLGLYNSNNSTFLTLCCTSVNVGTFTFPTNGKNFTIQLPASISGISGILIAPSGANIPYYVGFPAGTLTVTWDYENYTGVGLYYYDQATFFSTTPEPGSFALLGTGLIAIFASVRRRLKV